LKLAAQRQFCAASLHEQETGLDHAVPAPETPLPEASASAHKAVEILEGRHGSA
jgi:hypothetical protein